MITIQLFNKQRLSEFINSDNFERLDILPITKHRALSQINNPLTENDDILLVVAFEKNQLAGYVGCLPDYIISEKNKIKVFWISTIYVSPQYRGSRVFFQLFNSAISKCKEHVLMTEYTKEVEKIYKRLPYFEYFEPKIGNRYYFKSVLANVLPKKSPAYNKLKKILRLTDLFINKLYGIRLLLFHVKVYNNAEYLQNLGEKEKKFINDLSPQPMKKNADYINWLIKYPWVIESNDKNEKYNFSSSSREFKFELIKLSSQNGIDCIFLLSVRNKHLKIPYYFSENVSNDFIIFLFDYIKRNNIEMLTTFNASIIKKINTTKNTFFLYQKNLERSYMIHKNLKKIIPSGFQFNLQDGDSDAAFT